VELHLQPNWQRLLGQHVEVRRNGETVRTGTVEAVMPDNSILWISANGVYPRQMVERANGSEVYARYPWDAPPLLGPTHSAMKANGMMDGSSPTASDIEP
jgi:hypothetical protein